MDFRKLYTGLLAVSMYATGLSGTLKLPNGTGAHGHLFLALSQPGSLSAGCGGPAEIVPTVQVVITVTNGALSGSTTIYGNDCMLPQGTYYNVQFQDNNGNILLNDRWQLSGSSVDIGNIVSVTIDGTSGTLGSTGVVLFQPTGNQTINQPAGTKTSINYLGVTGRLTFPNGAQCDVAGCTGLDTGGVTLVTTQTIIGSKTFTSPILFGATTDLGSIANPARNGYFSGIVQVPDYQLTDGVTTWDTVIPQVGGWGLNDQTATPRLVYSPDVSVPYTAPTWTFSGVMVAAGGDLSGPATSLGAVGGYAQSLITGGDLPCSSPTPGGVPDGLMAIRTDVSPRQLQVCLGTVLYIVNLVTP